MKFRHLLLVFAASALAGGVRAQDTSGDDWGRNMRNVLGAWHAAPIAIDLAHFSGELPLGVRVDLTLRPLAKVTFVAAPHRAPKPDSFGGCPFFRVPKDGLYRVSAGSSVWIDVVETAAGVIVNSDSYGERKKSDLHKYVVFPLRAGVGYTLQISGSKAEAASMLITPVPARMS